MQTESALKIARAEEFRDKVLAGMKNEALYVLGTESGNPATPGYLLAQQILEGSYDMDVWAVAVATHALFLAVAYETAGADGRGVSAAAVATIVTNLWVDFKK